MGVALVAAALADPLVETVANSGMLGGHYADDNHLGVVPFLLAGLAFAAIVAVGRCVRLWRNAANGSCDWLVAAAKDSAGRFPLADLAWLYALQLLALYALEATEQLLSGGDVATMAWLGGPIIFSLAVHAAIGAACLWLLAAFMRGVLRTFASLAYAIRRLAWFFSSRPLVPAFDRAWRPSVPARAQAPHVRQIGGRAPPLAHATRLRS